MPMSATQPVLAPIPLAEERRALLAHFGSIKGVMDATEEDLKKVRGMSAPAAKALHKALREG